MTDQFLDRPLPLVEPVEDIDEIVVLLQAGRDEILRDWLDRVRDNRAVEAGQALSDPLLLDHVPQLFDAMLDRLAINRSRDDAEQWAAIHGFARRLTGYDVVETVIELLMFRRAIWTQLTAVEAPVQAAYLAMERIDGMVDRAVITSLKAFLDPGARMLRHSGGERG
jgi:2-C-methyl-D-erythritol 4-phosphate cytidylyltransferase